MLRKYKSRPVNSNPRKSSSPVKEPLIVTDIKIKEVEIEKFEIPIIKPDETEPDIKQKPFKLTKLKYRKDTDDSIKE
jgi:hypothetical protein